MTDNKKTYIGDGVYAREEHGAVWLTTEDGISVQNEICLEPEVLFALFNWINRLGGLQVKVSKRVQS